MEDVVARLEEIREKAEVEQGPRKAVMPRNMSDKKEKIANPWAEGSKLATALESFVSRIEDPARREKLEELTKEVRAVLGGQSVTAVAGVYNPVRLYRFLLGCQLDVPDSKSQVVQNSNFRVEMKHNEKRVCITVVLVGRGHTASLLPGLSLFFSISTLQKRIVRDDLSFDTLPRADELQSCVPYNNWAGRGKDGSIISYQFFGSGPEIDRITEIFPVDEYVDVLIYNVSWGKRGEREREREREKD